MRILEVCFADGSGGLELYAAHTSVALQSRGHEVLTLATEDTLFARRCSQPGWLAGRGSWSRWRLLRRALREFRPDILHLHHRADFALCSLACRLAGRARPALVYHRHMELPASPKKDWYHRQLYARVDLLVAVTERIRRTAVEMLPLASGRIVALHAGAPGLDGPSPPVDRGGCCLRAGSFSRIEPRKGQDTLIRALGRLKREGYPVQLALAGQVHDREYFQSLQSLAEAEAVADQIEYLGFLDHPQTEMARCDVNLHAAEIETFGLVIIESMRVGVPVIAAESGGVTEILRDGDNGLLYAPGDDAALAAHLRRLVDAPAERERLAGRAGDDAADRFSTEAHYDLLEAHFAALLSVAPATGDAA
ncbi:MAG: glycosyltransferase family 4 protein [Phycisphaerales bacterium]